MSWVNWISERFLGIYRFFARASVEVNTWWYPFNLLADPFNNIAFFFLNLAYDFVDFANWVRSITNKISQFFTGLDLENWFKDWKQRILDAWNWIKDAWRNVTQTISEWWSTIKPTVLGWIDTVKQWASELITSTQRGLNNLTSWWGNFTSSILPKLADWTGIGKLINSTLKEWFPFYNVLAEIWNDIVDFFTDPFGFIFARFEDWFWGGEK